MKFLAQRLATCLTDNCPAVAEVLQHTWGSCCLCARVGRPQRARPPSWPPRQLVRRRWHRPQQQGSQWRAPLSPRWLRANSQQSVSMVTLEGDWEGSEMVSHTGRGSLLLSSLDRCVGSRGGGGLGGGGRRSLLSGDGDGLLFLCHCDICLGVDGRKLGISKNQKLEKRTKEEWVGEA